MEADLFFACDGEAFFLYPVAGCLFRWARGANVRGNHKREGESAPLRSLILPLPLKVPSHTLLPYLLPPLAACHNRPSLICLLTVYFD